VGTGPSRSSLDHDHRRAGPDPRLRGIALPLQSSSCSSSSGAFISPPAAISAPSSPWRSADVTLRFSHLVEARRHGSVNIVDALGLDCPSTYGLLTSSRFVRSSRAEVSGAPGRGGGPRRRAHLATAGRTVSSRPHRRLPSRDCCSSRRFDHGAPIGGGVSVVLFAMVVAITLVPALCVLGAGASHAGCRADVGTGLFSRPRVGVPAGRPIAVIVGRGGLLQFTSRCRTLSMLAHVSGAPSCSPFDAPQRVFSSSSRVTTPLCGYRGPRSWRARPTPRPVGPRGQRSSATDPGVRVPDGDPAPARPITGSTSAGAGHDVRERRRSSSGPSSRRPAPSRPSRRDRAAASSTSSVRCRTRARCRGARRARQRFALLFLMTGSVIIPLARRVCSTSSPSGAALGRSSVDLGGPLEGFANFSSGRGGGVDRAFLVWASASA
jgi:RND superfamily putative drug exporter